ncbi:MAG TPA: hypothetical protein ENK75_04230, partial [Saprospiraceae bacterium]|nr:hypothetical protein [Saprospiraceae bacterium]
MAKYAQEYATHHLKVTKNTDTEIAFSLTDTMLNTIYNFPLTVKIRIPNNWQEITSTQNKKPISCKTVLYNGNLYALVKAIPDRGIVILKGKINNTKPKNNPISRYEMATLYDGFHVPTTISKEAQKMMLTKKRSARNTAQTPKANAPIAAWKKFQERK